MRRAAGRIYCVGRDCADAVMRQRRALDGAIVWLRKPIDMSLNHVRYKLSSTMAVWVSSYNVFVLFAKLNDA